MSQKSPSAIVKKAAASTPDCELILLPGWLIFTADDCYMKPQYAHFMIQNSESLPVVYRIRTKDRSFPQFSHCHGYLPPYGSEEITILITARGHWPREVNEYAGKRLKVLIENLTVPPYTTPPKNANAGAELSRIIFKSTPPLTRMYCKLNIILPKITDGSSEK
uniref:Major sperm protein n=1 Tax=Parascaris univalens TaxID=6257 RepID=A0A915BIN8_PARUN